MVKRYIYIYNIYILWFYSNDITMFHVLYNIIYRFFEYLFNILHKMLWECRISQSEYYICTNTNTTADTITEWTV